LGEHAFFQTLSGGRDIHMITTQQEAREFVHKTLATGNKLRIQEVLKRYYAFIKTAPKEDIVSVAERIFNV